MKQLVLPFFILFGYHLAFSQKKTPDCKAYSKIWDTPEGKIVESFSYYPDCQPNFYEVIFYDLNETEYQTEEVYYHKNGQLKRVLITSQMQPLSETRYDEQGNKIRETTYMRDYTKNLLTVITEYKDGRQSLKTFGIEPEIVEPEE